MQVSYVEDLANHDGPESCAFVRKDLGEALTGGDIGQVLSREILIDFRALTSWDETEGNTTRSDIARYGFGSARSKALSMHPSTSNGSREIPRLARGGALVRTENSEEVLR